MVSPSAASSRAAPRDRRRAPAWRSGPMGPIRSMSGRPLQGKGSKRRSPRCGPMHGEFRWAASAGAGCAPAEIEIVEGTKAVGPGGKSIPLKGLSTDGISAEGAFLNKKHTYTYGAHAAHVAVDPKLGHVELIDYVIVEDCGRIINPLTVHGQAIGSAVQGLGGAMMEHLVYDDQGPLLTGSPPPFPLPAARALPDTPPLRAG